MAWLMDLARAVRSKNAGSYEITFDIIFDDPELYERVKHTEVIDGEPFAQLYHIPLEQVFSTTYDAAFAFKVTLPHRVSASDAEGTEVYGT
jgi:hypothetical protein